MKKMIAMVTVFLLVMAGMSLAESVPFSEWIEGQQAVAEQAVVQDVPLVMEGEPLMPEPEAFAPIGVGSRGDDVLRLQTKLAELGFLNGKADGIFGAGTEAALKAVQKALGREETGIIQTLDELNIILAILPGNGVNLSMGTSQSVSLTPSGENPWCSPISFYPTSPTGLSSMKNTSNKWFTVSYDWIITGADTETNGLICLKYSDESFTRVGEFPIVIGDSSGHFSGSFLVTDGMREYGTGWLIYGSDDNNRNMCMTISNFKFECGVKESEWSIAPEDEGNGINLALATSEPVMVSSIDNNAWCSPVGFYQTSASGLVAIADRENPIFTVSFDWYITGADSNIDGCICLKYSEKAYASVGTFPITVGESKGHYSGSFLPTDGMRDFGSDWTIFKSGDETANREMTITVSNFKFEIGAVATNWSVAPDDITT